jgi:peptidoglycan hydrolase-like amidase
MGAKGYQYKEILNHYFPHTEICNLYHNEEDK